MKTLKAGTTTFRDFTDDGLYGDVVDSLRGAGRGKTVLQVAPKSSTRKKQVPHSKGTTNPLYVVKAIANHIVLQGFTIQGTDQGHLYNGIRADRATSLVVSDVQVVGIPGNSDINPGETFAINAYRCASVYISDTEMHGAGVGASGLGLNTCSGQLKVERVTGHNLRYCKAFALWKQEHGGEFIDCESLNNAFGWGFERCLGRFTLRSPKFVNSKRADIHLASDTGRCRVEIHDPRLKPAQKIKVLLPRTELGNPNLQQPSDITVFVDGIERRDLLQFVSKA